MAGSKEDGKLVFSVAGWSGLPRNNSFFELQTTTSLLFVLAQARVAELRLPFISLYFHRDYIPY